MPSLAVIAPVHEALVAAVAALLDGVFFDVSQATPPAQAVANVYDGAAPQRAPFPRVIVGGGGSSERPFHTLGEVNNPAKWGGIVEIPIRVIAQYPTTESQVYRIVSALKAGLERQPLTVAGFPSIDVDCPNGYLLSAPIGGVVTYEYVQLVEITARPA